MSRKFIQKNVTLCAIIVFMFAFVIINKMKPSLLYDNNGFIRKFGVGYQNKTIMPIWLVAIILSILSYMAVMYYLAYPKIRYN